jgi:hypothetical protein
MSDQNLAHELALIKEQAKVELNKLHAQSTAKEVAGKAIGESGLFYITLIIVIGVGSDCADLHAKRHRWRKR